jgi:hypothetical protein
MKLNATGLAAIVGIVAAVGCAKPEEQPPVSQGQKSTSNAPAPEKDQGAPVDESNVAEQAPSPTKALIHKLAPVVGKTAEPSALLVTPRGAGYYTASQLKALDLARKAEEQMGSLTGVSGSARTDVALGGGHGSSLAVVQVNSPKQYRADYPKMFVNTANPGVTRETVIVNNGQTATVLGDQSWSPKQPVTAYLGESSKASMDAWATTFPRWIFTGFGGGKPFTNLVEQALKAGMEVSSEERYVPISGRNVLQRRILISRKPEAASKLGAYNIEVVFDGTLNMPVTVRTNQKKPNQEPIMVRWTAKWRKMGSSETFPKDAFNIPVIKPSATKRT